MVDATRQYATPDEISRARDLHQTDEVEIDDDAKVSPARDGSGVWVAAWVWLSTDCE